jgi:spore coat-associated protein S
MFAEPGHQATMAQLVGPEEILTQYHLDVAGISLIRDKGKKRVWRITTPAGDMVLKKMPGTAGRSRFIARSIRYLEQAGAGVPNLISTRSGDDVAVLGQENYLLMEWLSGNQPDYRAHFGLIMQGLAQYHKASAGFKPFAEGGARQHLNNWPDGYAAKMNELILFREQAARDRGGRFEQLFLGQVDYFLARIKTVQRLLSQSCYAEWNRDFRSRGGLCHQDFTPKNLRLQGDGRLRILDPDSVTIDIPARDLRKIFNKVIKKYRPGDPLMLQRMESSYQEYNPLTREQWEVVFTDFYFPHLFCGAVNKYFTNRAPDWPKDKHVSKLAGIIETERHKAEILADRLNIREGDLF